MSFRRKIGVRYCGGCNPRYDRGALVKRIIGAYSDCSFENAGEGEAYDVLLVVGGCGSCCASYEQYKADKVVKVWENIIPEI